MKSKADRSKVSTQLSSSFRDPAGFVFADAKGQILRQINPSGRADFDLVMSSKLYEALTQDGLLVRHKIVKGKQAETGTLVLKPQQIRHISYPFEWSFSQLQDAALTTLAIQKRALQHGLSLKDASAFNIQFENGKPVFIDTLSFEAYTEGAPWQAYRQFCQHFLAPLALMAYTDVRLLQLARTYIDGVPLDLAVRLLPRRARVRAGLLMHVFLHARAQQAKASEHQRSARRTTKAQTLAIIESLERTVRKLRLRRTKTEWGDYYHHTNYSAAAADQKATLIKKMVQPLGIKTALDVGGNNGRYSRVLNQLNVATICTDIDPNAVEANYQIAKQKRETLMLPLLVDYTNPGGALGWHNTERPAVHKRLQTDLVMALAVIHHLAISNNLPMTKIAEYFSACAPWLVLEFVPKEDSQVQKLLSTREDIFPDYHAAGCEAAFGQYYTLKQAVKIRGTKRTLYLFKRKP